MLCSSSTRFCHLKVSADKSSAKKSCWAAGSCKLRPATSVLAHFHTSEAALAVCIARLQLSRRVLEARSTLHTPGLPAQCHPPWHRQALWTVSGIRAALHMQALVTSSPYRPWPHPPCPAPALYRVLLHELFKASLNGAVGIVQGSFDEGRYRVLIFST